MSASRQAILQISAKQKTRRQGFGTHPRFPLPMLKTLHTVGPGLNASFNTQISATHLFCVTDDAI